MFTGPFWLHVGEDWGQNGNREPREGAAVMAQAGGDGQDQVKAVDRVTNVRSGSGTIFEKEPAEFLAIWNSGERKFPEREELGEGWILATLQAHPGAQEGWAVVAPQPAPTFCRAVLLSLCRQQPRADMVCDAIPRHDLHPARLHPTRLLQDPGPGVSRWAWRLQCRQRHWCLLTPGPLPTDVLHHWAPTHPLT